MPDQDACIIVFAKAPEQGKVKTRLIPALGARQATELYEYLVAQTIDTVTSKGLYDVQLWCTPDSEHDFFHRLSHPQQITLHDQVGDDLGKRMGHAFDSVFKHYKQALIIGTDCPYIQPSDIEQTFALLRQHDAVITPAIDGGYVMLGLTRFDCELFDGITWGTSDVFTQTQQRLTDLNYTWKAVAEKHDIDRLEDVIYLKQHCDDCLFSPAMQKFIQQLKI